MDGKLALVGEEHHDYEVKLSASGDAEVSFAYEERGTDAIWRERSVRDDDEKDHRKRAERDVTTRLKTRLLQRFEPTKCERKKARCRRVTRFSLPGYASLDEGVLVVPLGVVDLPLSSLRKDKRCYDVVFAEPWT